MCGCRSPLAAHRPPLTAHNSRMHSDPPNEYFVDMLNRVWWFAIALFVSLVVHFVLQEYKHHQRRLNDRARLKYKDED